MLSVLLLPGFRKTRTLKPNQLGFGVLLDFALYWVFWIFYLNEQYGSLSVDLVHQLSFYLDSPVV